MDIVIWVQPGPISLTPNKLKISNGFNASGTEEDGESTSIYIGQKERDD